MPKGDQMNAKYVNAIPLNHNGVLGITANAYQIAFVNIQIVSAIGNIFHVQ